MTEFEAVGVFENASHPPSERIANRSYDTCENGSVGSVKMRFWVVGHWGYKFCLTIYLSDISLGYVIDVDSICRAGDVETAAYDRLRDQAGLPEGAGEFHADQFRSDLPRARETRKRKIGAPGSAAGEPGQYSLFHYRQGGRSLAELAVLPERSSEPPGVAPSAIFRGSCRSAGAKRLRTGLPQSGRGPARPLRRHG